MGPRNGFPNPPAMVRAERSPWLCRQLRGSPQRIPRDGPRRAKSGAFPHSPSDRRDSCRPRGGLGLLGIFFGGLRARNDPGNIGILWLRTRDDPGYVGILPGRRWIAVIPFVGALSAALRLFLLALLSRHFLLALLERIIDATLQDWPTSDRRRRRRDHRDRHRHRHGRRGRRHRRSHHHRRRRRQCAHEPRSRRSPGPAARAR